MMTMWCSEPAFVLFTRRLISRPTPRLLSFALCLEWINGIYNTPDTGCLECYRQHASVNTTTLKIDRKHIHCRNMLEIRTRYIPWIVNKRPRNLLNEIQNVFINGKQVKIDKITQIIPWFPRFYAKTTTGNSQRRYRPHAPTVTFARWQRLPTKVSGCGQLAGGLKVGRRYKCVSTYTLV